MHFSLYLILEESLENSFVRLTPSMMHVAFFVILDQPWLATIQNSRRGKPEIATGGLLLPRAAPLLLPRAMRWKAPAIAAPLLLPRAMRWEAPAVTTPLLPCVYRRWEALAVVAPLLLPHARRRLNRTTRWRCGWWILLLLYAYRWLLLLLL
jgi:hypothetical protein